MKPNDFYENYIHCSDAATAANMAVYEALPRDKRYLLVENNQASTKESEALRLVEAEKLYARLVSTIGKLPIAENEAASEIFAEELIKTIFLRSGIDLWKEEK